MAPGAPAGPALGRRSSVRTEKALGPGPEARWSVQEKVLGSDTGNLGKWNCDGSINCEPAAPAVRTTRHPSLRRLTQLHP
jgi:hypothetical protein